MSLCIRESDTFIYIFIIFIYIFDKIRAYNDNLCIWIFMSDQLDTRTYINCITEKIRCSYNDLFHT